MSKPLLCARGLHKSYKMGRVVLKVLTGASLDVGAGEFLAIMGPSGSGKSTLLHLLGALDVPDRGSVQFDGWDLFTGSAGARARYRNRDVGFVFQFYHLLPELSVFENVLIPSMVGCSWGGWLGRRREKRRATTEMLERVGLADRARHRPNELSGGERQRVAIARALVHHPRLLLADEPTGNLDETIGGEILKLLTEFNQAGQTIVMVTHDPAVAARAHRLVHLSEGAVREEGR